MQSVYSVCRCIILYLCEEEERVNCRRGFKVESHYGNNKHESQNEGEEERNSWNDIATILAGLGSEDIALLIAELFLEFPHKKRPGHEAMLKVEESKREERTLTVE